MNTIFSLVFIIDNGFQQIRDFTVARDVMKILLTKDHVKSKQDKGVIS